MEWLQVATSIFSEKNNTGRVAILDFQIYYTTMVIKKQVALAQKLMYSKENKKKPRCQCTFPQPSDIWKIWKTIELFQL